jgi:hypothetical protein
MLRISSIGVVVLAACCACSVYDVAALSADAAMDLLTDVNEDANDTDGVSHNDSIRFWSSDVSGCIRSEKKRQALDAQLDGMFESIEQGQRYVLLPTGEKYAIDGPSPSVAGLSGPTATCLSDTAEH